MAHLRARHALPVLEKLATFSPLIGVLGHRQVGKTTLMSLFSEDYRSFDQKSERLRAEQDIEAYVETLKGTKTVIDESQLVPDLFPELKERVRKNKRPGQFVLSGSIRFTSKKLIRESLTGRIQYIELLPFSVSELEGDPLSSRVHQLVESKNLMRFEDQWVLSSKLFSARAGLVNKYLTLGGLPGSCFIRDDKMRRNHLLDQLQTILDRDIRQIYPTSLSYQQIFDYVRALSTLQGQPIRLQALRRETELTPITQRKLLYALESVFLLRRIPIEGGRKGFTVIFEDQGESHLLSGDRLDLQSQLTQLLYRNIRAEYFYQLEKTVEFFQYRSLGRVTIPLGLRIENEVLGFYPIRDDQPNRAEILGAQSFLKHYSNSKVVFFHRHQTIKAINERMISLPLEQLL